MSKLKALATYLSTRPDIQTIYFDGTGNWVYNKCNLFPESKTREEILEAAKAEPDTTTTDAATQALNKLKKKK